MTDAAVERLSRWTAGRTTRRSFLHRLGQFAVLIAAGPTIAGFLLKRAEARVCGQTGVTPKCDTFDCAGPDDVWGWCWYASDGCCRNDGLKKICDCCTVDYPNVHGYCPSGTNVRCIVESCGTDPRVTPVDLVPVAWQVGGYSHAAIRARFSDVGRVVMAPADDKWVQLIAAPLAGALGAPLMTMADEGPTDADYALLADIGVKKVVLVGDISLPVQDSLSVAGIAATRLAANSVTGTPDLEGAQQTISEQYRQISVEVANAIAKINDINRTVTVETTGFSAAAAPLAAIMAALNGFPLVVGSGAAADVGMPTFYIGAEPQDAGVPSERTKATTLAAMSIELAELAVATPFVDVSRLALAPDGSVDLLDLVNLGAPIVLHPPTLLGPLEQWLQDHSLQYGMLSEVFFTRGPGELTTEQYWHLQSAVNGFRVDQLMGVPGEGLPVFRQPWAERPLGKARTDGALPLGSIEPPSYWTDLGQTLRQ